MPDVAMDMTLLSNEVVMSTSELKSAVMTSPTLTIKSDVSNSTSVGGGDVGKVSVSYTRRCAR